MRDRRPFPDIEEQPAPATIVFPYAPITTVLSPEQYASLEAELQRHQGENRRQRRKAVATFEAPKDMPESEADGLRRRLLEQRKLRALGTLDVALRRLQRKALRK